MVCLGLEPGAAGWKAQTNPLSYGGTPKQVIVNLVFLNGSSLASFFDFSVFFKQTSLQFYNKLM